jgi:hypothetical protein
MTKKWRATAQSSTAFGAACRAFAAWVWSFRGRGLLFLNAKNGGRIMRPPFLNTRTIGATFKYHQA